MPRPSKPSQVSQVLQVDASQLFSATWADEYQQRIRDYRPALTVFATAFGEQVDAELRGNYWRDLTGRRRNLEPPHDLGRRKAKRPVFGAGYAAAWRGGAGAIREVSSSRALIGVQGFPRLAMHRGGLGPIRVQDYGDGTAAVVSYLNQQAPWKLARGAEQRRGAQRYALWWRILRDTGVPLKDETLRRGLRIPMRPHANLDTRMRTYAVALISAATAGRPLPAPPKV